MITALDKLLLEKARLESLNSKDPSTKTGAIIFDPFLNEIVGRGHNRFPKNVEETQVRLINREIKYKMMVHCERNAMLDTIARHNIVYECTLYTYPFMSCCPCAGLMIEAGIKRCVAPWSDNPRWKDDFDLARQMFKEAGVQMDFSEAVCLGPPAKQPKDTLA